MSNDFYKFLELEFADDFVKPKFIKEKEMDRLKEKYKPTKPEQFSKTINVGSIWKWRTTPLSLKKWTSAKSFEVCRSIALVGHPFLGNAGNYTSVEEFSKENLQFVVLESYDVSNSVILKIFCNGKIHWIVLELKELPYEIKKLG